MQAQVTMRPTHGFSYQATYTWSKNLGIPSAGSFGGTTTYTDPLNLRGDYTFTSAYRAHDFRSYGTFELPIGPNRLLLANSTGWVARLAERWQTSFILNLTSGSRSSITANQMFYGNGVPDVVGPFSSTKGHVRWGDSKDANGQLLGSYFGTTFTKVTDPQCQSTNVTDKAGFNLFQNGSCTLFALADAKTSQILLQNPQPGHRGTLGQNTIELPGVWQFDANASKSFRVSESKMLLFRVDATDVLNHPDMGSPNLSLTNNTANFGVITSKGTNVRNFQAQLRLNF
jgi:hypothetical protein